MDDDKKESIQEALLRLVPKRQQFWNSMIVTVIFFGFAVFSIIKALPAPNLPFWGKCTVVLISFSAITMCVIGTVRAYQNMKNQKELGSGAPGDRQGVGGASPLR